MFRGALGDPVSICGVEWIGHAVEVFRNTFEMHGLRTINSAGAGKEETLRTTGHCEVENIAGAVDYLVITLHWCEL